MAALPTFKARPRLRDIADQAQLSVTTVSMALRDSDEIADVTRARVRKLAERMGYSRPAQVRRTRQPGRTVQRRFGICFIGATTGVGTSAVIRGASAGATATSSRVEVLMIEQGPDPQRAVEQIVEFSSKLDGTLLWGFISRAILEGLAKGKINYMVLGTDPFIPGELPESMMHLVSYDAMGMGWSATTSLLRRGHRRIGFVCEEMPPRMYNANWLAGYRLAHWDATVPVDESLCVVCGTMGTAGEKGTQAVLSLAERPTGYVFSDASAAAMFLEGLKRHEIAPRPDAVVVGVEVEQIERYGFADHGLIISNLDRVAEIGLTLLDRAAAGMPLPCGRLEIPFSTRNLEPGE